MSTQVQKPSKSGKSLTVGQYAAFVHEMTSPPYGDVEWTRPGSGPKFLEASLKRNASKASKIMAAHIKGTIK